MTEEADENLLPPGTEVAGRYRIVRPLAAGGMGQVYVALNIAVGTEIALKTLHGQLSGRKELVARFRREAYAASSVGHENIIVFTDAGFDASLRIYYLCSELLRGDELRKLMNEGALTKADLFEIMLQVCGAVDAAHRKGVVHRDLKPENLIITRDRRGMLAKVLDFGIAKVLDAETTADLRTKTNAALGTPGYMSPEQFTNAKVDAKSDVFALGCILYECLSGREPFDPTSLQTTMLAMMTGDRVPLEDAELEAIVAPALLWDHGKRMGSARELADALERYQANHSEVAWIIHAPSVPSPAPVVTVGNNLVTPPEVTLDQPEHAADTVKAPLPEPANTGSRSTHHSWSGQTSLGSAGLFGRHGRWIAVAGAAMITCAIALLVLFPRQNTRAPVVVRTPPTTVVTPTPVVAPPTPEPVAVPNPTVAPMPTDVALPTPVVAERRDRHGRRGRERNVHAPVAVPTASAAHPRGPHCADERFTYNSTTQRCCYTHRNGRHDCDGTVEQR